MLLYTRCMQQVLGHELVESPAGHFTRAAAPDEPLVTLAVTVAVSVLDSVRCSTAWPCIRCTHTWAGDREAECEGAAAEQQQ